MNVSINSRKTRAVASSIMGGGRADIHIFVFTHHKKQSISKEFNCAEHEYMNISPPPPIIELAKALLHISSVIAGRKQTFLVMMSNAEIFMLH